ncbi:TetR/AcrR family transcriptional regulator [Variovorax sp. DAIF25]|uniref:TetR/AcrR family transcriptional regulator n=1 Tax=Variovorax sp. DAIF25 TaxID=3080983 RepID=UPI003D6B758B
MTLTKRRASAAKASAIEAADESPWVPSAQRAMQRELKRQAVLQTAAQLFNERGFHATSLDDIAERLHVTKPTLYYYVKSKDDILLECVRAALGMMQEGIDEVRRNGGRALDQLMACMRSYSAIVCEEFGKCVIRIGEDPLPEPLKKELRRLKAGIDHEFRRLIDEGIAEGSIAPCDPKMAAFMLAGALSWIGRWYRRDGDLTPEQIADQAIALLLNGVLQQVPAAPARRKTTRATAA